MRCLFAVTVVFALAATTFADEKTGVLEGRFWFDAPISARKKLTFGADEIDDPSLLVDVETHGIQNIVVSLFVKTGGKLPEFAPAVPGEKASLFLAPEGFAPRISLGRAGGTLRVENIDKAVRIFKADSLAGVPAAGDVLLSGAGSSYLLKQDEKVPILLSDPKLAAAKGYLIVTEHPFVAVSDLSGRFIIPNLPPGEWTFRAWHERSGYVESISRDGKAELWKRGQFTITIKPGENDLGWINVATKEFPDAR